MGDTIDTCPNCGRDLDLDVRFCSICTADASAPNVRFAARAEERAALADRELKGEEEARAAGAAVPLERLRERARASRLVINRSLRSLSLWVESEDELYVNFYRLKERGVAMKNDRFNRQRTSAENTISPTFFDQLVVGALTIDGKGMSYYGGWSVIVREADIRVRASVFWDNPFLFNDRMDVISGKDPPVGFRAPWGDRDRLAVAKLAGALEASDDDARLAQRFMGPDRASDECDFIEVHVHGDIHAAAIEAVAPPDRMPQPDRTEWRHLRRKLADRGVAC